MQDDEEWCGSAPKIQTCYDDTNGFFLWVRLDVDKKRIKLPEEAERAGLDVRTHNTQHNTTQPRTTTDKPMELLAFVPRSQHTFTVQRRFSCSCIVECTDARVSE